MASTPALMSAVRSPVSVTVIGSWATRRKRAPAVRWMESGWITVPNLKARRAAAGRVCTVRPKNTPSTPPSYFWSFIIATDRPALSASRRSRAPSAPLGANMRTP